TWRASTLRHSSRFIITASFRSPVRARRKSEACCALGGDGAPLIRRRTADQQHHGPALRIGLIDGGSDLCHVRILFDLLIRNAHAIEDGFDDAHAIMR